MPELPEIECITRSLRPLVVGKSLSFCRFFRNNLRKVIPTVSIAKNLAGLRVSAVHRRSKYLALEFTGDGRNFYLLFHMGMSGVLLAQQEEAPQVPHTHAVFAFAGHDDSPVVYIHYVDPRRFGVIDLIEAKNSEEFFSACSYFSALGPEPFVHENLAEHLFAHSRKKSTATKTFLMNAENLVGVGNIYANESLHRARVNPLTPVGLLDKRQMRKIASEVKSVLREAIDSGGSTLRDFCHPSGGQGGYAAKHRVYGRDGDPCLECGQSIERIVLAGRSTFYCANCTAGTLELTPIQPKSYKRGSV